MKGADTNMLDKLIKTKELLLRMSKIIIPILIILTFIPKHTALDYIFSFLFK